MNMQNEKEPIGYLFGNLGYNSPKDISNLIDNLTHEQALVIMSKAVESAFDKGVYTLIESEILSKSLRILSSNEPPITE